ncbi:uncharacterized protein MYCGRDRAFT_102326 [Zymoseptoria tritici IPO323]|uniref:Uncharacterized protein n=1 Tax=Zymoseptoria tritici (strain CBS 115943 / IPO323) TaxID=336722 RepID=F9WWE9_ZYMTI|nr:uncharacterized protein MYCGRDRAFT_102326 [Zymoseptoria tritici IPO323]EGP91189.1 hypothetical protein MYCGRDRAFT_102326 [Zymoseptoria tritici IPO323]
MKKGVEFCFCAIYPGSLYGDEGTLSVPLWEFEARRHGYIIADICHSFVNSGKRDSLEGSSSRTDAVHENAERP